MRALHWFRNDLRLHDNTALAAAAARAAEVLPVFVFDAALLRGPHRSSPRQRFLLDCLERLAADLAARGCPLVIRHGDPVREITRLAVEARVDLLTFNLDHSPYARRRDDAVRAALAGRGVRIEAYKDRVVFDHTDVRKADGGAFVVYTPFRAAWLARYRSQPPPQPAPLRMPRGVVDIASGVLPSAAELGIAHDATEIPGGGEAAAARRLTTFLDRAVRHYERDRARPGVDGTSRLSPYLRFGAISVRHCVRAAFDLAAREPAAAAGACKWVDELIWRDFYSALLAEHPRVLRGAFRRDLADVRWNDDDDGFRAWCEGRTGFPFVDAAMRQLLQTGWMHNRARMVVASFLAKDLLIDWRRGERFFMDRLVDGDPASNNGGWQWAASTGTDAQPYFRIFNPVLQGEKFDPDGVYVRRFVPEVAHLPSKYIHRSWQSPSPPANYPAPIVEHGERRVAAIARYEAARAAAGLRPLNH